VVRFGQGICHQLAKIVVTVPPGQNQDMTGTVPAGGFSPQRGPAALPGEVMMWESELTGGCELPMVCAVTGKVAVTRVSCRQDVRPGSFGLEDGATGSFPVCASVRLRARLGWLLPWCTVIAVLGWPAPFAGMAIVAARYGLGRNDLRGVLVIPVMCIMTLAGLAIMAAAMKVREMLEVPVPRAVRSGFSGGERWFAVRPVHPRFAAAVNGLPRPRPR
jgi:hypothetical protein